MYAHARFWFVTVGFCHSGWSRTCVNKVKIGELQAGGNDTDLVVAVTKYDGALFVRAFASDVGGGLDIPG